MDLVQGKYLCYSTEHFPVSNKSLTVHSHFWNDSHLQQIHLSSPNKTKTSDFSGMFVFELRMILLSDFNTIIHVQDGLNPAEPSRLLAKW